MTSSHHRIRAAPSDRSLPANVVVRVELTPAAKQQSVAVAERLGMTQVATLSRLLEWFTGRSATIQASVLGRDALAEGDVSRIVLREMANPTSTHTA